jgi:hypothetical protein
MATLHSSELHIYIQLTIDRMVRKILIAGQYFRPKNEENVITLMCKFQEIWFKNVLI